MRTKQRTYPRRTGADNQHCIIRFHLRYTCSPIARRQNITRKQSLLVTHALRNPGQSLIRIRYTHVFSQSAVYPAPQSPSAIGLLAIIHVTMLAEKAPSAKCLYVHRHTVTRTYARDSTSYLADHAHHFMADCYTAHRTWHTAMLNVQIAGTDTGQRHPDYCVSGFQKFWLRFVNPSEPSLVNIRIS